MADQALQPVLTRYKWMVLRHRASTKTQCLAL